MPSHSTEPTRPAPLRSFADTIERLRLGIAYLLLAGCNAVLGLEPTRPLDDDLDDDGVADSIDNCPAVANSDQADEDADTVGDVCDNCPNVANRLQQDDGDFDGIGDDCDPHPVTTGDCLVTFDSFNDIAGFDTYWMIVGPSTPAVMPMPGTVVVTAEPSKNLGFVRRDLVEPVSEIVAGHAEMLVPGSVLRVLSNADTLTTGSQCAMRITTGGATSYEVKSPTSVTTGSIGYEPVIDTFAIRMINSGGAADRVQCRGEIGISLATFDLAMGTAAVPGAAGVLVNTVTANIDSIAQYRVAATCSDTVMR